MQLHTDILMILVSLVFFLFFETIMCGLDRDVRPGKDATLFCGNIFELKVVRHSQSSLLALYLCDKNCELPAGTLFPPFSEGMI